MSEKKGKTTNMPTKTIKTPVDPLEHSQKKWEQRVSKMKKPKVTKPARPDLPKGNKTTVGSLHGLTRTEIMKWQMRENREK